jgi:hypothetical protein
MKKIFLFLLLVPAVMAANAQHARLNLYSSYVFEDGFDAYNDANNYYSGRINAGLQLGAGIEYLADPTYGVELLYFYKKSDAPSHFKLGTLTTEKSETFDVTQHFIMLAANSHVHSGNQKIEGVGSLMLGMLINDVTAPSTGNSTNHSNFAWGGRLGMDYWLSAKLGIRLQAQILSATRASGGDVYYGYWGPVAVPDYTTLWQFGLGGGLTFKLGK